MAERIGVMGRVQGNLANRVKEPAGGFFGNILRDNFNSIRGAIWGALKPVASSAGHIKKSIGHAVSAPFAPVQQFFGAGIGEVLAGKPQDALARTGTGVAAGVIMGGESVSEAVKSVTTFGDSFRAAKKGISEVFTNTVFGVTRMSIGFLLGKRAAARLYEVQPYPSFYSTPWLEAANNNDHFEGASEAKQRAKEYKAHQENYSTAVYDAHHSENRENQDSLPTLSVHTGMKMAA